MTVTGSAGVSDSPSEVAVQYMLGEGGMSGWTCFSGRLNNSFSHSSAVGVWPGQLKGTVAAGQDILCTP